MCSKRENESETVNEHEDRKTLWQAVHFTQIVSHLKSWVVKNPFAGLWKPEDEFPLVVFLHEFGVVAISGHLLYHVVDHHLKVNHAGTVGEVLATKRACYLYIQLDDLCPQVLYVLFSSTESNTT